MPPRKGRHSFGWPKTRCNGSDMKLHRLGKLLRGSTFEEDDAICIPRGVQARLRGDRVEAAWLALALGTLSALGESQEPKSAGSHARSGRRLELRPRHKAFLIPCWRAVMEDPFIKSVAKIGY